MFHTGLQQTRIDADILLRRQGPAIDADPAVGGVVGIGTVWEAGSTVRDNDVAAHFDNVAVEIDDALGSVSLAKVAPWEAECIPHSNCCSRSEASSSLPSLKQRAARWEGHA